MREISLSQGQVALVDDEDYERLSQYKWHTTKDKWNMYALNHHKYGVHIRMHRMIIDAPKGKEIDHLDGNGLNNQKSNLRVVTHRENTQNKHPISFTKVSRFPGVSFHMVAKRWYARYRDGKKTRTAGYFDTEEEAYAAYISAVKRLEHAV